MKTPILCFLFLLSSVLIYAQDTIFLKTGVVIPALIIDKGDVEIKYKKFTQPESAGIYSVFASDIAKIHFKNGSVIDYNSLLNKKSEASDDYLPKMKFNIGISYNYFNRNTSDDLKLFWQALNNDKQLDLGGNKYSYALNLGMGSAMGTTRRNWFGATLQLILTPPDAIFATNFYNGLNEIKLGTFYYNMSMYYGHTLDHKKRLILLIEPGIDMVFMSGYIIRHDTKYKETGMSGMSYRVSFGLDWNILKRLQLNLRVGEQFVKVREEHKDESAKYGYSNFYINPVSNNPNFPQNLNDLSMRLNGLIASAGLSYALYAKVPTGRQK